MNYISLNNKKIGLMIWKTSNLWQGNIRNILKKYDLTFNEFIVLETLSDLKEYLSNISQIYISKSSGIDVSVVSTTIKMLEKKSLIQKRVDLDNRKRIIELTKESNLLLKVLLPKIYDIEDSFFKKLGSEEKNFCNSLRLLLGRKIRIKAERF